MTRIEPARLFVRPLAGLAAALALLPAAATAQQAALPPSIDSLVGAFMAEHRVPGAVVAVVRADGEVVVPFGVTHAGGGAPVGPRTRFEIGSVTKALTALLLAEMAERGEVALDDPIGRHLPDPVRPPAHPGGEIRLWQLATHVSGLPRLPGNLRPASMADPYADYDAARLMEFVGAHAPARAPGEAYEYSNLGAGLLGHLLARRAGRPYGELLHERVLAPLGMTESGVPAPGERDSLDAGGHAGGQAAAYWHMDALAGAGAVRASALDLVRLVRAQLDPASTPLAAAIRRTHEVRHSGPGQPTVALAWHVSPAGPGGERVLWHNGGTGGFRSFVGFAPDLGVGVVVLANAATPVDAITMLGMRAATLAAAGGG